jgi:hypothetical protein
LVEKDHGNLLSLLLAGQNWLEFDPEAGTSRSVVVEARDEEALRRQIPSGRAELPAELQKAIDSSFPSMRETAVRELTTLLRSPTSGVALKAREALMNLRNDDSRRVSTTAIAALEDFDRALQDDVLNPKAGQMPEKFTAASSAPVPRPPHDAPQRPAPARSRYGSLEKAEAPPRHEPADHRMSRLLAFSLALAVSAELSFVIFWVARWRAPGRATGNEVSNLQTAPSPAFSPVAQTPSALSTNVVSNAGPSSESRENGIPVGTHITFQNWEQFKAFMPYGMIALFDGKYFWKIPADLDIEIGATKLGNLPKTFLDATDRYNGQAQAKLLSNRNYSITNYRGGQPFPHPQEPDKGFKILANVFFAYAPALYVNAPSNHGTIWLVDRYGNIAPTTLDVVYRQSGWNTDPGFSVDESYNPGTWYTEWIMQETPEPAKYTTALLLFYKDQETHPHPDIFVFISALRRSLRLSDAAACAPLLGTDWAYDDAKGSGFNAGTSTFNADFVGERKTIAMMEFNSDSASFPENYLMPLGFPKPSWGDWQVRDTYLIDAHRIPQESAGYCYSRRVMYVDQETYYSLWTDLYDSEGKLWKMQWRGIGMRDLPQGHTIGGVAAICWDVQNIHASYWSGIANPSRAEPYIDLQAPAAYRNGTKYGTRAGLNSIIK